MIHGNEEICRSGKSQDHRGYKKVKCEISQALVMITLYVKFNVHSTYTETSHSAKTGGQTDGRA